MSDRPPYHRPNEGRSATPLLCKPDASDDRGRRASKHGGYSPWTSPPPSRPISAHTTRSSFSRRNTLRSQSPSRATAAQKARKKWAYAAFFLLLSLVSFCVQTELAAYVAGPLGWDKAYCMLYLTHGSWSLLFPVQLLVLRLAKLNQPWAVFWRRHTEGLVRMGWVVMQQQEGGAGGRAVMMPTGRVAELRVKRYLLRTTAIVTSSLTVAGLSWYIAVNMTSPSDLTAIYNCSAFFAYAFSVPLLKEPFRRDKTAAVLVAIIGVLVVAYGDTKPSSPPPSSSSGGVDPGTGDGDSDGPGGGTRFLGNLIIGAGSVLYGLYEVLYKRLACPPSSPTVSTSQSTIFANFFGSLIGLFTLSVLWIPLPILHWIGWERFELPTGRTAYLLFISVIANATFAGSFLVLISLTSPVLSSVAALLTIFLVAIADWALTGEPLSSAAVTGGLLIVAAFAGLSWATWREIAEEGKKEQIGYESLEEDEETDTSTSDEEERQREV